MNGHKGQFRKSIRRMLPSRLGQAFSCLEDQLRVALEHGASIPELQDTIDYACRVALHHEQPGVSGGSVLQEAMQASIADVLQGIHLQLDGYRRAGATDDEIFELVQKAATKVVSELREKLEPVALRDECVPVAHAVASL